MNLMPLVVQVNTCIVYVMLLSSFLAGVDGCVQSPEQGG